jgi:rfaE bifunctional protein kinase chain/domain
LNNEHYVAIWQGAAVTALKSLIPRLAGQRILVVGDAILDEYLNGKATRMSREAPVPVLEFESRTFIPGGAANPAANIAALGSTAIQIGVIGADSAGENLCEVLRARGIDTGGLITDTTRPTTVKTRIMAHMGLRFPQQIARLDTLSRDPISPVVEQQVFARIREHISSVQAMLLSDYHVALLTEPFVKTIQANASGALLAADAQGQLDKYSGFGLVKCNADEARSYLRREIRGDDDFAAAALELCERLKLTGGMVITRGSDGATVATCDGAAAHCPAPAVTDVYDTVGAGDTAIAVLTLAVVSGASYTEAAMLANYASGLVVRRVGNYAPTPEELAWAVDTWGQV